MRKPQGPSAVHALVALDCDYGGPSAVHAPTPTGVNSQLQRLRSPATQSSKTHCIVLFCCLVFRKHHCGALQPINILTAAGAVETAVLHLFEQASVNVPTAAPAPAPAADCVTGPSSATAASMRVCALHQRSPIQMYMYDSRGRLLNANKAALEGLQPGDDRKPACKLCWLEVHFDCGTTSFACIVGM